MRREEIVSAAQGWIGTPYRHQASLRGSGADCLGLVRGIWRELLGDEPVAVPPYTSDWSERTGREELLEAARQYLVEIPIGAGGRGDVLLFRMGPGCPAKHCAIVSEAQGAASRIIHAYWGRSVTETRLVPWWQRRIAAAFSFPQLERN